MIKMSTIVEPEKRVPVVFDVDVVVAGAGVAGVFAAIAAARYGAVTVLIDRFGSPGGNIGPGMIAGGNFLAWPIMFRGFAGIPKEFIERHASLGGGSVHPYSDVHYLKDSNVATYVALKMLRESGVKLLLSTYVADPIMEDNRVRGVFVENKSGRRAVRAKVVIDATGEADIARRAGVPILYPKASYNAFDQHAPSGMGIFFAIGGIDCVKYKAFEKEQQKSASIEADTKWSQETVGRVLPTHLLSLIRTAWESGEYRFVQEINGFGRWMAVLKTREYNSHKDEGLMEMRMQHLRPDPRIDASDGSQISNLEAGVRMHIFETAQFLKRYVPGFENCYLLCVSPFLGTRGGTCIEGEYTLTVEDCRAGRKFDDVTYIYGDLRAYRYTCGQGQCKWVDVPYRVMVPKKINALLAVGRSASGKPDTLLRQRVAVMHMGQVGGTAAALALRDNVEPRMLDVKELQWALLDEGFYLGSRERLKQLSLI